MLNLLFVSSLCVNYAVVQGQEGGYLCRHCVGQASGAGGDEAKSVGNNFDSAHQLTGGAIGAKSVGDNVNYEDGAGAGPMAHNGEVSIFVSNKVIGIALAVLIILLVINFALNAYAICGRCGGGRSKTKYSKVRLVYLSEEDCKEMQQLNDIV